MVQLGPITDGICRPPAPTICGVGGNKGGIDAPCRRTGVKDTGVGGTFALLGKTIKESILGTSYMGAAIVGDCLGVLGFKWAVCRGDYGVGGGSMTTFMGSRKWISIGG